MVFWQRRLHLLTLFLLDTGARVGEALNVRVREIDFDNLLLTLDGKGRKQRIVPFSFELRRAMFRYIADFQRKPDSILLATRNETKVGRRVMLRTVKNLCQRLRFQPPARTLHAFRHTFAVNYLRRGGSVFHLQKVLGHSTFKLKPKTALICETFARLRRLNDSATTSKCLDFPNGKYLRMRKSNVTIAGVCTEFLLKPSGLDERGNP
jgi:integrase/recombinase XerD